MQGVPCIGIAEQSSRAACICLEQVSSTTLWKLDSVFPLIWVRRSKFTNKVPNEIILRSLSNVSRSKSLGKSLELVSSMVYKCNVGDKKQSFPVKFRRSELISEAIVEGFH